MKKISLAVFFLAIVVAVSYFKATRQSAKSQQAYQQGKSEGIAQTAQLRTKVDSLGQHIVLQEDRLADSVAQVEKAYSFQLDSLKTVLDSVESKNRTIVAELDKLQSPRNATSGSDGVRASAEATKHKQILTYYKRRFDDLPKDLSQYESKAARSEIRQETAQKFSITLKELDKIREKYKVNY